MAKIDSLITIDIFKQRSDGTMLINESTALVGGLPGDGGGGTVDPSTAPGQMLFGDAVGSYSHTEVSELFWDDTNKRLGLGTGTPQETFDFDGSKIRTQRYLDVDHNTNFGHNTFGAGNMIHTGGTEGWNNAAFGTNSMVDITTGSYNTGCGRYTLNAITAGTHNSALGANALGLVTTGTYNVGIGASAGRGITTNTANMAIGGNSLYNTNGYGNVGIGSSSLYTNISGSDNVAIGRNSLVLSTGSNNVGIGTIAGDNLTSGGNNIAIGYNTDFPLAVGNNQLNIGNTVYGDILNKKIGIGTTTPDGVLDCTPDTITVASYSYPLPRITTTQRTALTGMLAGAHVYDTDLNSVYYYNGTAWTLAY